MHIKQQFEKLFNNEMSTEEARSFLIDLYEKGETSEDIAAAASVMREHSLTLDLSDELKEKAIDIVGTGGDKSGSFNISTTVSLLLASMGLAFAYSLYTIGAVMSIVFVIKYVYETKGRELEDMEG